MSTFLRLYKKTCRSGPDGALLNPQLDLRQRPLRIGADQYLDELYLDREVESFLERKLRTGHELTCLIGPQGAGKTSLGHKLRRRFSSSLLHKVHITFLDIRTEEVMKACETGSKREFESYLRGRIIDEYLRDLFPLRRNADEERIKLWSYLLTSKVDHERPANLFFSFRELEEEVTREIMIFERGDETRQGVSVESWLKERYLKERRILEIIHRAEALIDIHHLVYAARFIKGYDRQIIWLDNIDALPENLQPDAVHFARRFHNIISSYVATVVAVREENVFRFEDLNDDNVPPFESRVLLDMPRDDRDHTYYPSIDVPVMRRDSLNGIIRKRLQFTRDIQHRANQKYLEKLKTLEELPEEEERLKKTKLIEELDMEAEDYEHPISDQRFDHIRQLSDLLLETFWKERAIYIANNSIRDILMIHRDCLGYLLRSPDEDREPPESLSYNGWYRSTLFHTWIRSTGRTYTIELYDILERTEDWLAEERSSLGCVLPYLVITAIWNHCLEREQGSGAHGRIPKIGDVVARLEIIGFEREDILQEIYAMYLHNGRRGHLVEVRSRLLLDHWKKLEDHFHIYATYRGKCIALRAGNSFGYLYECVRRLRTADRSGPPKHPAIKRTGAAARELLAPLCDIAEMHLEALVRIRDSGRLGKEWLTRYLKWFGLPQVSPYKRKIDVGLKIGGFRRALQFQCLISGVLGAARMTGSAKTLRELENRFTSSVEELGKSGPGEDHPSSDFRAMLGLEPRTREDSEDVGSQ